MTRSYSSKNRSRQAAETRKRILEAAGQLFRRNGWERTSIAAIARAAGVSAETVYAVFANKRGLLRQLIVDAVRRDRPDLPLVEQQNPRAVFAADSAEQQIALFAADVSAVLARVAPLVDVVRTAAASEPELAGLYRQLHAGRRENLGRFVDALLEKGQLRRNLDRDAAIGAVWRLASPELYTLMTDIENMDGAAFAGWLAQTLHSILLPD